MTVHHTRALFQEVAALSNLPLCHTALSQRGIADIFSAIVRLPMQSPASATSQSTTIKIYS